MSRKLKKGGGWFSKRSMDEEHYLELNDLLMRLPEYNDLINPDMRGRYSLTLIPAILRKMNDGYITGRFLDKLKRRPYSDNNLAKLYYILRIDNSEYLNIIFGTLNGRLSQNLRGIFTRIDYALSRNTNTPSINITGANANARVAELGDTTFAERHAELNDSNTPLAKAMRAHHAAYNKLSGRVPSSRNNTDNVFRRARNDHGEIIKGAAAISAETARRPYMQNSEGGKRTRKRKTKNRRS
jgi:hypothetical protein